MARHGNLDINSGRRLRAHLLVAFALAFTLHGVATARDEQAIRPGERLWAELSASDELPVAITVVPGTVLTVKCSAWKGATLRPDVRITDPDGDPVVVAPYLKANRKGNKLTLKKLPLDVGGTYHLWISGDLGTVGGLDIKTSAKVPTKFNGEGAIGSSPASIRFGALDGDLVTCKVEAGKRSPARPSLVALHGADGGTVTLGGSSRAGPLGVRGNGEHVFDVVSENETPGSFRYKLKVKQKKPSRVARDAWELTAAGSISGRILVGGQPGAGPGKSGPRRPRRASDDLRPGELIVSVPDARGESEILAALEEAVPGVRFELLASLTGTGPHLVRVAELTSRKQRRRNKAKTRALAKAATAGGGLAWAEPNRLARPMREPNDASWPAQDDMRQMWLPEAWDLTTGDPTVTIAVVDTGIWSSHPDLQGRLLPGYDFVGDAQNARDGNGWDSNPADDAHDFHGTHVAGTIGAATNNRTGVAGVVWNARMVPVRVLGEEGGTAFDIAAGIRWAAGLRVSGVPANPNPARVINLSLGGYGASQVGLDAVTAALDAGVVLVAAAGNDDVSTQSYPAAYPGVIAVSATAPSLYPASYSNYGDWIDVSAPGGQLGWFSSGILSTFVDERTLTPTYTELQGTSMASPHVAGVVALMLSVNPDLTPTEVEQMLESSAFDLGADGFDVFYGWGMVDAEYAVLAASATAQPDPDLQWSPQTLSYGELTSDLDVYVRNAGGGSVVITDISVTTDGGGNWLSASASSSSTPATVRVHVSQSALGAAVYTGNVTIQTSEGRIDVPVQVNRLTPPNPGFVRVQAIDEEGRVAASTTTSAANGWAYSFDNLPLGSYRVEAYADKDGSLVIDRVDEWSGAWPLSSSPDRIDISAGSTDATGVDFGMERYDTRYAFEGAGGGPVDGAIAVRIFDKDSRLPIPGAAIYLGNGVQTSQTDARGRAVLSGAFSGAQPVTVVADGYATETSIGQNAQYQTFALEREAPPTFDITVTVRGLEYWDGDVFVQVGNDSASAYHDGVNDPVVSLRPSQTRREIPVWVMVWDDFGDPSKLGLITLGAVTTYRDLSVEVLAYSPDDSYWFASTVTALPANNFDPLDAAVYGAVSLYWTAEEFLRIGNNELEAGVPSTISWMSLGDLDSELPAATVVSAADYYGAVSAHLVSGYVDDCAPPPAVQLLDPSYTVSPSVGELIGASGPSFQFQPTPGSNYTQVEIWDSVTGRSWYVRLPGNATQFTLPVIPGRALAPGREYWWQVFCMRAPGTNFNSYQDSAFTLDLEDFTVSWWDWFNTQ